MAASLTLILLNIFIYFKITSIQLHFCSLDHIV